MTKWHLEYWQGMRGKGPIEKWLDGLSQEQFKSVAKELIMLKNMGSDLKLPHSRALGKGLFELRERKYGYRIYYGFGTKYVIVLVAAGNKSSQERDIQTARERLLQMRSS